MAPPSDVKKASQLRMLAHLAGQVEDDAISNDWERIFIMDLVAKNKPGFCYLTDRQDEKLTELFERY